MGIGRRLRCEVARIPRFAILKRMFTNEERRVPIYSADKTPTIPHEVTARTPLDELNLDWREKDLPERVRTKHVHRLHPYLGKFIPQLVEIFLRKYFVPGQTVLDPFCGSGTTLVQAAEQGINAVGYDISAFNVLLCRVKLGDYDLRSARKEALDILDRVRSITQNHSAQLSLWNNTAGSLAPATDTDNAYLREWFAPQALHELLTYRDLIESRDYQYKDLLKIVLSRSARSSRLTTHFDLDFPKKPQTEPYYCYKHSRICQPTTDAFQFLRRYTLDTLKRIEDFAAIRKPSMMVVRHEDSRQAEFPPIHGVITSPPYVGLIDYHEQHAYAYYLLGLVDQSTHEIGPASGGSSQAARSQYQQDIAAVFRRALKTMPNGGRMIVVANDKSNLYEEIARLSEVEVEAVLHRHVNRRTGRRSSDFYESVFVWRKP